MVSINKTRTDLNIDEINLLELKIHLEACALNIVGHKNVTRQVSAEYKEKGDYLYRIDNYNDNYVIYVFDPNDDIVTYYMIFNNAKTNETFTEMTIFEDGYLIGEQNELES